MEHLEQIKKEDELFHKEFGNVHEYEPKHTAYWVSRISQELTLQRSQIAEGLLKMQTEHQHRKLCSIDSYGCEAVQEEIRTVNSALVQASEDVKNNKI